MHLATAILYTLLGGESASLVTLDMCCKSETSTDSPICLGPGGWGDLEQYRLNQV